MGNESSQPSSDDGYAPGPPPGPHSSKSEHIAYRINYAKEHYETNPTDSLLALMEALTLNNGEAAADQAMSRIRSELGPEIADHVENRQGRMERAVQIVQEMLNDESTFLYEQGNSHLLQQAMEDGSSVVCTRCNAMVKSSRWQQHQEFWCEAIQDDAMEEDRIA